MSKDWDQAKADRDTGMANAASGQDDWNNEADEFAIAYATACQRPYFMCEDIVEAARGHLSDPRDARAWGPVMKRVERMGYIVNIGTGPARTSNTSPKTRWASVEYLQAAEAPPAGKPFASFT